MTEEEKNLSELRQDIVSGEWVVIATGRARRPNEFAAPGNAAVKNDIGNCPFESLESDALLVVTERGEFVASSADSKAKDWFVEVIPNKYPAFFHGRVCATEHPRGPYRYTEGIGSHEVIVFRPHDRPIHLMSPLEVSHIIAAYRARFRALIDDGCLHYISILHNHGPLSGASIAHPHSQLIAVPIIPPDVGRSLNGSARYFHEKKQCVHCVIIEYEKEEGVRMIYENEGFAAMVPYASHAAFEIRIYPKRHEAYFQNIADGEMVSFADALQVSLAKLAEGLNDPSYNFFIHTAPVRNGTEFPHYHWHLEILPKTATWGGFEFGTGIQISTITPESAAEFLRKAKTLHNL